MQTNHATDTQNKQALNTTESHLVYDTHILDTLKKDDPDIYLRFWESSNYTVVLGKSNSSITETYETHCKKENISIIKRISGGAA